jgi:DNA-binding transcriptional LysR family regulator
MDLRALTCFIAVAEELHFRRAALRLNLTQSALSQRIRSLEDEIGTTLLERDRRNVAITPAGAAFLEHAKTSVASAGMAKVEALRAARGDTGRLRLGFTVIAFYGELPRAVRRYRDLYPDIAIELSEMNSPALEAALASDEIDLGVLHPPLYTPGLALAELPPQRMVLALPEGHPLAEREVIAVRDLAGEPMLMGPRSVGPSITDRMMALLYAEGIEPRIVQEVSPMTTLTGLVSAGAGVGFVTEGIATVVRPGVVFRPVEPEPPAMPMAAAWREDALTPTAARFLEAVRGGEPSRANARHLP